MTYIRTAVPLKVMPVAMRKRSWEEHVTQRSGLQYSFDDLDIICCHAVVCDALQSDLDISTYGRRGRCVSLPDWHREQWGEGRALAQAPGADIGATHPGSDLLPSMVDKAETLVHSSGDRPEVTSGDDEASHYEHAGLPEVRHFSDTPPAKPLNQGVTAETEEESCGSLNDCRRITDRENFTFQRNCYEDNNHEACSKSNAVDSYHFQDCLYRVVSKNEPILHEAGDTLLACCDAESDVKANLGETQKVNEECDSTDSTTEWLTGTACLETACLETACLETACLETAWLETPCLETACLETACLETACLETACLETACLETACLETACLETPCLETPCLETACLETAWLETPCLETACLETACLETACLETACLETACLETPCLETQCLETACLETACLEAACLETACLETACVRKTLEERDSDPLSVGLISADEVDGPMVGECVDAPSETNGHREEPCFGLLEKSHRAETTEAEPGCHEAEPGYHEAEPGCHEAERGDHEAEPGYHEAEPGYHEAEPGYHEAEPGCHEAEPGCPEAEPGYSKAEPGFHEAEPGYSKAEPGCPEAEPGCHEAELGYHKAEDNTVKLRKRKSSTGERERSRLDSMVLLIMKLDRLDRDIDSALSSTSSISNTPSLRKRNVPEMDFREINGGEISNSTQHLKIFHNLMCSTLSSSRPVVGPGVKHTAGIMPVISEKAKAEIEAKEVCDWLRAAGFPQYAQLYEDSQFPIEISAVTRDHDFLDRDAIEALCRRLNTLNQCAAMRLDVTPQRKRSEDSDEDEPWAISSRWTFQRDSKRWSRQEELDVFTEWGEPESAFSAERPKGLKTGDSAESVLTDLSEQPEVGSLHSAGSSSGSQGAGSAGTGLGNLRTGSVNSISGQSGANEGSSEGLSSAKELSSFPLSGRPGGKNTCSKAKSFLKRMESLRLKSSPSKKKKAVSKLMISGPVLQEGVDEDKLRRLNCVEISSLTGQPAPRSRSVSYSTLTTTTSSSSSSSAVSTPSPVTRARRRATTCSNNNNKRGGMYLEGFDALGHLQPQPAGEVVERNRRNQKSVKEEEDDEEDEEETIFFIPEGHKPGTFPTALSNSSPHIRLRGESSDGGSKGSCPGGRQRRNSASSLDSRLSLYDNVPSSLLLGREWETEEGLAYSKLDDILQHVHSLQLMVNGWSEEAGEEGDSDSALDSASPCPSSPLQNRLEEGENGSDLDSTGNSLNEQDETLTVQERRDSGVGASLTRSNRRPQKLRWNSFLTSHRPSLSSTLLQVDNQSVVQMNLLQKFSLLKLTALLERHAPSSKHGVSWAVPKFMKRIKVRDYKDRNVFGVPLQVIVQRTGQPLPQSIQQAMRYLRNQCLDQVGLFRKSGVKSRIQALRQMNETCPDSISYEGQSAFDVADMLKQYFRDLPEPLLTSKLSETFLQIYQYVPKDQRLQAIRAAALLLPDENREVLQVLLFFLSDVTANVQENQMTSSNLAVCLAPSLFHLNTLKRENSSPRLMHRKQSLGKPDQRDLNENLAATQGLAHMISECKKLFQIPEEMSRCRNSYTEHGLHPPKLSDLMEGSPGQPSAGLLKEALDSLLKEAKEKFRGYDTHSTPEPAELACKKVLDGLPLRLWKTTVEVPATPGEVLRRILRDQHRWDEDLLESRVVETLGNQAEIYQYVQNNMAPHPARDHVVLRTWVTDLPKGACAMVCTSVDHEGAAVMGVRANVLTARYFIEPCGSNKSRLTYISRIDSRGHCPEWYNKMAGHLCAAEVVRIRDSFTSSP